MINIPNERNNYSEGRNFGLGFTFLKKTDNGYIAFKDFTCCKDFLNDALYTEHRNKECKMYGYKTTTKQGYFENDTFFVGIKVLPIQRSKTNVYPTFTVRKYDDDVKLLKNNYKNVEIFLNNCSKLIKDVPLNCKIEEAENDIFIVELPKIWSLTSYAISFITFLIRAGMAYDGKMNVIDYLENTWKKREDFNSIENGIIQPAIFVLQQSDHSPLFIQDLSNYDGNPSIIHDHGFCHIISKWKKK